MRHELPACWRDLGDTRAVGGAGYGLLDGLSSSDRALFVAHTQPEHVRKGQAVFQEGDAAGAMYLISSGIVCISTRALGREVILGWLGEGEIFGELALIDSAPRSATVRALRPTTLRVVPRSLYEDSLQRSPTIVVALNRIIARRLRMANRKIERLVRLDIRERVEATLAELAFIVGEPTVDVCQRDLASMVGATREMVNRTLRTLVLEGRVAVRSRQVELLATKPARRSATHISPKADWSGHDVAIRNVRCGRRR